MGVAAGTVTRVTQPAVRAARKLRRRRGRAASGLLLVEGPHAVGEASDHLERVFVADSASAPARAVADRCRAGGTPVLVVSDDVLAALSDAEQPQGVVGVARRPAADLERTLADDGPVIVLDRVRDPGNLGTVVRTADAAGAAGVVLTSGSVDPTNAKAVRASAGSVFHLPVVDDVPPDVLVGRCRAAGRQLIGTDSGAATAYHAVALTRPVAVMFGNEAHGLAPELQAAAALVVSLPIARGNRPGFHGAAESLNLATAAAVILYEAVRQRDVGMGSA